MADRKVIIPRWLVPVEPEGVVLENHALVLAGEVIESIVPVNQIEQAAPDAERIELPGHALIPGLVNAHTHSAMALMRGLADDLPLMTWLEEHIWPVEQHWVAPGFVRSGAELAIVEMLTGGTTCFNDNYFFPDVTAQVAVRAGMRAVIGLPIIQVPTAWASTEDEYFSRGLAVHQELADQPLVTTAFAPHAPYTVSDEAFARMGVLAREMDVPIHLHLLEAAGEIESSRENFGKTPLDRLDKLGLLNDRLLAVHMTQIDANDIERIARHGVHVLHCPASNLKLASGICPVAALDRAGVNVCIGTDGAASNNTLDMFAETRLAALLAKGSSGDPEAVPAARALSMATINGARALRLGERVGSIRPGKQADLAAVRLDYPETLPVHNVISQLIYAVGRHQVSDVWVAGRPVVSNGECRSLDVAAVCEESASWQRRLAGSAHHSATQS